MFPAVSVACNVVCCLDAGALVCSLEEGVFVFGLVEEALVFSLLEGAEVGNGGSVALKYRDTSLAFEIKHVQLCLKFTFKQLLF